MEVVSCVVSAMCCVVVIGKVRRQSVVTEVIPQTVDRGRGVMQHAAGLRRPWVRPTTDTGRWNGPHRIASPPVGVEASHFVLRRSVNHSMD